MGLRVRRTLGVTWRSPSSEPYRCNEVQALSGAVSAGTEPPDPSMAPAHRTRAGQEPSLPGAELWSAPPCLNSSLWNPLHPPPPWPLPDFSQRTPHPHHGLPRQRSGHLTPVHCRSPGHPDGSWVSKTGVDWGEHVRTKTLPVYRMRLIIPGITTVNMGSSFRYPQRTQPPFT